MPLVMAIAEIATGALLITKGITGATWRQILTGQAEQVYQNNKAASASTGTGTSSGELADVPVGATGGGTLNSSQRTFAQELAKKTGLNLAVVEGWVHAEEPASASQAPNGPANWLNVGATGSGYFGGGDSIWDAPKKAADATAQWLEGKLSVPGFGTASLGVKKILLAVGDPIGAQVSAIQESGWAKSGYPQLPADVAEFR